jgi:hypothetical protein
MKMKTILTVSIFCLASTLASGQILISILLGDKLNSDKMEFGLDGGLGSTNIRGLDQASPLRVLHLGFYFDIKLSQKMLLHTGLIVKSTMGADGLPSYTIGDAALDPVLATASVTRKISYFSLPIFLKAKLPYNFFVELGPQLGLYYNSKDEFIDSRYGEKDLLFRTNTRGEYTRIDAGVTGGVGYRLLKGTGISIGLRYYQGMVDIIKDNTGDPQYNSSVYLFGAIPIGGVKKQEGN